MWLHIQLSDAAWIFSRPPYCDEANVGNSSCMVVKSLAMKLPNSSALSMNSVQDSSSSFYRLELTSYLLLHKNANALETMTGCS